MNTMRSALGLALSAAVVAGALTVVACGGGAGTTSSIAPPPPPPPSPSPSPSVPAQCTASAARLPAFHAPGLVKRVFGQAGSPFIPDRIAARFSTQGFGLEAERALRLIGASPLSARNDYGSMTFAIPAGSDPEIAAAHLRGLPGVVATGPLIARYPLGTVTPNDPRYKLPDQWALFKIDMGDAWGFTEGIATLKLAIVDTGVDLTHPDLAGKVVQSVVFDKGNGTQDVTASAQDGDGHGTNVSGIAAADTNNALYVAGVGFRVSLLEARVFPTPNPQNTSPGASTADVAAGINWAVNNGAKVINLSLGGAPDPMFEQPAVNNALSHGVVVVAAAGNDGNACLVSPAAYPGVISVGASALDDHGSPNNYSVATEKVAGYSDYGNAAQPLDVVAPGGDPDAAQIGCGSAACIDYLQWILNLFSTTAFGDPGHTLALFAGTSQASPHVAGIAALMLSKDPALTPSQVRSIIDAHADNINDPKQGHGRVNAFKVLSNTP